MRTHYRSPYLSRMAAWTLYHPTDAAPWNLQRVVHLHRRAGFGATWGEIQRDLADGPQAAVSRLLAGKSRLEGVTELSDVDQGDLKPSIDFHRIYATLLESWLGADSTAVLSQAFDPLPCLKDFA